jgi:hypothetical protein
MHMNQREIGPHGDRGSPRSTLGQRMRASACRRSADQKNRHPKPQGRCDREGIENECRKGFGKSKRLERTPTPPSPVKTGTLCFDRRDDPIAKRSIAAGSSAEAVGTVVPADGLTEIHQKRTMLTDSCSEPFLRGGYCNHEIRHL